MVLCLHGQAGMFKDHSFKRDIFEFLALFPSKLVRVSIRIHVQHVTLFVSELPGCKLIHAIVESHRHLVSGYFIQGKAVPGISVKDFKVIDFRCLQVAFPDHLQ